MNGIRKENNSTNKLKEIRLKSNITGIQAAEYLNITPSFYYALENGKKTLTEEYLRKLSVLFEVSVDSILGIEELKIKEVLQNDELPKDLKVILKDAKELTTDQIKIISTIIKEFRERNK